MATQMSDRAFYQEALTALQRLKKQELFAGGLFICASDGCEQACGVCAMGAVYTARNLGDATADKLTADLAMKSHIPLDMPNGAVYKLVGINDGFKSGDNRVEARRARFEQVTSWLKQQIQQQGGC